MANWLLWLIGIEFGLAGLWTLFQNKPATATLLLGLAIVNIAQIYVIKGY